MSTCARLYVLALFSLFNASWCCINPAVTSKSFTTQDATIISNIGYITQFNVKCKSGSIFQLYADINGNVVVIPEVAPDEYQVSWTEEISSAHVGDIPIRIYDEDGYALLKRAARSGEEKSAVPYLFTVVVNHPGAFTGPWLKSEFVAAILASVVLYFALSSRAKLMS